MKIFWAAIVCIVVITVLAVIFLPDIRKPGKTPVLTERERLEAKHDLEWMDSELKDDIRIDSIEKKYRDTLIKLRTEHMNKYFNK